MELTPPSPRALHGAGHAPGALHITGNPAGHRTGPAPPVPALLRRWPRRVRGVGGALGHARGAEHVLICIPAPREPMRRRSGGGCPQDWQEELPMRNGPVGGARRPGRLSPHGRAGSLGAGRWRQQVGPCARRSVGPSGGPCARRARLCAVPWKTRGCRGLRSPAWGCVVPVGSLSGAGVIPSGVGEAL